MQVGAIHIANKGLPTCECGQDLEQVEGLEMVFKQKVFKRDTEILHSDLQFFGFITKGNR